MNLFFATEARFIKNKQQIVYAVDKSFSYNLWERYLETFEEVHIVARVCYDPYFEGDEKAISSGKKVFFKELPYYIGWFSYLKKYFLLKKKIKQYLNEADGVFICRVPGVIGGLTINRLRKMNKSFGVEVVGDPWDVFSSGVVKIPLRSIIRLKAYYDLKKQVQLASAILYVTKETLQKKYPPSVRQFSIDVSDVKIIRGDLHKVKFVTNASNVFIKKIGQIGSKIYSPEEVFKIISIGSLSQLYKGPDVLIKTMSILKERDVKCKLIWLGDGKYLEPMRELTVSCGVENEVSFIGSVPTEKINQYLNDSDLFVLASRTEGLPRVVIEAMAVGLPCVATRVGGIPELLEECSLVDKEKEYELADKIQLMLENANIYNEQAERNLAEAEKYTEDVLNVKRLAFYNFLKENQAR